MKQVAQRRLAEAGFTLLELMLALALMALIMAMLFAACFAVVHGKSQGEEVMERDQEGRAVLYQLARELKGAVQTPIFPSVVFFVGEAHSSQGHATDSIAFSTLTPTHRFSLIGMGAEEIVAYSLKPDPDNPDEFLLVRTQRSALLPADITSRGKLSFVLARHISSLHLRYYDGVRWNESWNSRQMPPFRALPQAVSVELAVASANAKPRFYSTVVTLPMAQLQR